MTSSPFSPPCKSGQRKRAEFVRKGKHIIKKYLKSKKEEGKKKEKRRNNCFAPALPHPLSFMPPPLDF